MAHHIHRPNNNSSLYLPLSVSSMFIIKMAEQRKVVVRRLLRFIREKQRSLHVV